MKRIAFTAITAFLLFATLITPSSANAANQPNYATLSAENLAYSDLKTAPEEWQNAILAARNSIIYSESWTVDGQVAIELSDGSIEKLPEFSDLFPGWDVPKNTNAVSKEASTILSDPIFTIMSANYAGYVYLQAAPTSSETPIFYAFNTNANRVSMVADSLPGSSYNAGYSDLTSAYDVGWATNLSVGRKMYLTNPNSSHSYGARASTNSTPGYALMGVVDDPS
ncbi:hypothetical protein [Paenibacillus sp. FSL R7-0179]|uniref:hypothetical protein n=1 Tax=Paenibacillus sp. FSL R7-0179 TaxID=2921672 RepID=UPI0030F5EAD4